MFTYLICFILLIIVYLIARGVGNGSMNYYPQTLGYKIQCRFVDPTENSLKVKQWISRFSYIAVML